MLGLAKYVGRRHSALLAFLFFVTRHLRRREGEELLGEPAWLREIEAPTTSPSSSAERLGRSTTACLRRPRVPQRDAVRGELEELIDREPERVAQQVRAWMKED